MRAATTQESNLAELGDYAVCVKLEVDRSGSGDYQDLTDFSGYNWVKSVQYSENIDDPVAALNVMLASEIGDFKLSPFAENSLLNQFSGGYTPALSLGRHIKLYTATMPHMMSPTSGDWRLVFDGYLDEVDPVSSDDEITVRARNLGAVVQDLFIETTQVYGADSSPFEAVEDVMQDILDDNLGVGVVTLYTPSSPSWNIMRYAQQREPVLNALRALAAQIGWDVRYKWRSGTSQFELTFVDIDRTKSTPDKTYAPGQVLGYQQMVMRLADVRNAVRVVYTPLSTQDRTSVLVTDSTSIANYGRRYFEAAEASSSNVDTSTEANLMANAILADLKDPSVNSSVVVPYSYEIELGDLLRFEADNRHFDSDLDAAVVAYQHTIGQGIAKTTLQLRGKPAGKFLGWLRMEARAGVAPIGGIERPDAATSGAVVQTPTGLQVTYDDPTASDLPWKDWAYSECHISTTSGFTPTIATLYAQGKTTTFTISGLAPRTTYYIKIVVVDVYGNKSLASSQVVETQSQFAVAAIDGGYDAINLVRNGEFCMWDPGVDPADLPPSGWTQARSSGAVYTDYPNNELGDWGSGSTFYYSSSDTQSGDYVIQIDSYGTLHRYLRNRDWIPIVANRAYEVVATVKIPATSSNMQVNVTLIGHNQSYAVVGAIAAATYSAASGTWVTIHKSGTAASTVRWARLLVFATNLGASGSEPVFVDSVFVRSLPDGFSANNSVTGSMTIPAGTTTTVNVWAWGGSSGGYNNGFVLGSSSPSSTFTCKDDGTYQFGLSGYGSGGGGASWYIIFLKNGATTIAQSQAFTWNGYGQLLLPTVDLVAGDTVVARIQNTSGAVGYLNNATWAGERLR